jgi:hypothetical protein
MVETITCPIKDSHMQLLQKQRPEVNGEHRSSSDVSNSDSDAGACGRSSVRDKEGETE